jgi:gamma-glutamyltranspeptidase
MKALHARFGTRKWSELAEPAARWAKEGAPVHSFQMCWLDDKSGELCSSTDPRRAGLAGALA